MNPKQQLSLKKPMGLRQQVGSIAVAGLLVLSPLGWAESQAQRQSDAKPVEEYSTRVSYDENLDENYDVESLPAPAAGNEYLTEGRENTPYTPSVHRSRGLTGQPYQGFDYSGQSGSENRN